jgi:hypothetical protein
MDKTYVFTRKQLVAFAKEILRRAAEDERQEPHHDLRSKLEGALTVAFVADGGKVEHFAARPLPLGSSAPTAQPGWHRDDKKGLI